jgi:hypothetical protein
MKRQIFFLLVLVLLITSCGEYVRKDATVIDKVQTFDKYGRPSFYVVYKIDGGGVKRSGNENLYYKVKIGDRINVSVWQENE